MSWAWAWVWVWGWGWGCLLLAGAVDSVSKAWLGERRWWGGGGMGHSSDAQKCVKCHLVALPANTYMGSGCLQSLPGTESQQLLASTMYRLLLAWCVMLQVVTGRHPAAPAGGVCARLV